MVKPIDPIFIGLAINQKMQIASKSIVKAYPDEKVGVFCKRNGKPSTIEYTELPEDMRTKYNSLGELEYGEATFVSHLLSINAIEKTLKHQLKYHLAVKNGLYKFESFVFDVFENFDDMLVMRVKREEEFAPIKNKEGADSPETATKIYESYLKNNVYKDFNLKVKKIEINNLLNLNETISKKIFENCKYPWEIISKIEDFIIELGNSLDKEKYEKIDENIWIAKSAKIAKTASITGPCIIDENAEIRHCSFIRKNAIIGKEAVVGNSTEIKNAILFNNVQVPHFSYVGDSILGYKAHLGAGVKISNIKSDKTNVKIKFEENIIETNLRKLGAIVGDYAEVGCNSVLNPGTIIGRNSTVYPLLSVRGMVQENSIYKNQNEIIQKL